MAQQSIKTYFTTRKRLAPEELKYTRSKVFLLDRNNDELTGGDGGAELKDDDLKNDLYQSIFKSNQKVNKIEQKHQHIVNGTINQEKIFKNHITTLKSTQSPAISKSGTTKSRSNGRVIKNNESTKNKISKDKLKNNDDVPQLKQQNLVKFIKKGLLSPRSKVSSSTLVEDSIPLSFVSKNNDVNIENGTKNQSHATEKSSNNLKKDLDTLVRKELKFEEVKTKVTRSAKLQELKASINRLKELEKIRKVQETKSKKLKNNETNVEIQANLKKFETIELEVLTSPQKGFKTPTKPVTTATANDKNDLMSPRKTATPKRVLFSPIKSGSPVNTGQTPAYQKYQNLVEQRQPDKTISLPLPYKYRYLIEIFRCTDSICFMFYNRKEMITFKKLQPAVQRMLRKNFNESHLAQIKQIYPDAYQFVQMKTRNFGSLSKQDYFQLVITPNIVENEQSNCNQAEKLNQDNKTEPMNAQIMIDRLQKFSNKLLEIVKNEHEKFLKSLDPPIIVPKEKITRWHPEFNLDNCPDIVGALLPQPPNVERFSSAKDMLSTARNLFNCATPMERAMKNYEEKMMTQESSPSSVLPNNITGSIPNATITSATNPTTESILKGVPKSLLEKIRTKQAAKMLDLMTRSNSEDREIIKYSRLPELARHLRNVFITEKKSVLLLDIVLKKIEISYKTILTQDDIEQHLRLLAKELPQWIGFHEIRKTLYLKLNREMDLLKIIEMLKNIANEKCK